jgi:hypothetical protein
MSEERGLVGTIFDDVGETYQRALWQDSGITPPESATPDIGAPEIGLPEVQFQEEEIWPPDTRLTVTAEPDAALAGEPGDVAPAQDFTPIEAPIIDADYEDVTDQPAIEAPTDNGPDIGPPEPEPEGPDMG